MNHEIVKMNNKLYGEFYAIRNAKAKTAFTNPMKSCQVVKLYNSDIVADIGAYIGEYAMIASNTASIVNSYEASPDTFKVLQMNKRANVNIFNKAVVGGSEKTIDLYLSKGIGATNSIVKTQRKASKVTVEAINYIDAVKDATVAKIDVEGAEYTYDIIQPNLRAIILEFHPMVEFDWKTRAENIMTSLEQNGFKPLLVPKFKNGWDTNSAWVRN